MQRHQDAFSWHSPSPAAAPQASHRSPLAMDTRGLSRWPLLAAALLASPGLRAAPIPGVGHISSFTNSIEQEQDSK
jgi:hypothetical protein